MLFAPLSVCLSCLAPLSGATVQYTVSYKLNNSFFSVQKKCPRSIITVILSTTAYDEGSPGATSTSASSRMPRWWQREQQSTLQSKPGCRRRYEGLGCASPVRRTSRHPPARTCPIQTGGVGSMWGTTARIRRYLQWRASFGRSSGPAVYIQQTSSPLRSERPCTERWCLQEEQSQCLLTETCKWISDYTVRKCVSY